MSQHKDEILHQLRSLRGRSPNGMADELLHLHSGDLREVGIPESIILLRDELFVVTNNGFDGSNLLEQVIGQLESNHLV